MTFTNNIEQKYKINFSSYKTILISALIIRILAAIFSQGYGMQDDHFLVIEASSSWVDGYDYNNWLPWNQLDKKEPVPEGHSFTYVGLNYVFFYCCKVIGINDPKILMLLNRLIHGLLSLLVVYFGIKITDRISNHKNAVTVGWLLALFYIMPFLSVRNLVELAAIPYLIWGVWLLVKEETKKNLFYAGILIGLAVSFRYQIAIFGIGIGLYYLLKKKVIELIFFGLGGIIIFSITQGIVDYFIWGRPFAEFLSYTGYNMVQGTEYLPNHNYLMYVWVLMGFLLFPFGVLIGIGFIRSAKQNLLLFLPTFLFFLFHTFYPNRQERFILSIFPFFIILGVIGYQSLKEKLFWKKLWSFSITFFWCLNIPLVLFGCFVYSKKSRVEAMYSLYGNKIQNERILMEGSASTKPSLMPKFYADSWHCVIVDRTEPIQPLLVQPEFNFDYIFFFGEEKIKSRIKKYKKIYPKMKIHKVCEPSLVDKILTINPHNTNQYIEVWETNAPLEKKK